MRKLNSILFLSLILISNSILSQAVFEVVCSAYYKGRSLKGTQYVLRNQDKEIANVTSKNGDFQFAITQGDSEYVLDIKKENFIGKRIYFRPNSYPFQNEYEIQEIDLEFVQGDHLTAPVQEGELKWSAIGDVYGVVKIEKKLDGITPDAPATDPLRAVYKQAISNADELYEIGQYKLARNDYAIALLAQPDDSYASKRLEMIIEAIENTATKEEGIPAEVLDKINRGEMASVDYPKAEFIVYSVQLGAFRGKIDEEKFKNVPEFRIVQYDDFARCFSGEFSDINLAVNRKADLIKQGMKDAWIVKMKGNQRLGF